MGNLGLVAQDSQDEVRTHECLRLRKAFERAHLVLTVLSYQSQIAHRGGHADGVADRSPESVALEEKRLRRGTVTLQSGQYPRRVKRFCPHLCGQTLAAR